MLLSDVQALDLDIAGAVLRRMLAEPAAAAPARPGPEAFAAGNYNIARVPAPSPGGRQLLAGATCFGASRTLPSCCSF